MPLTFKTLAMCNVTVSGKFLMCVREISRNWSTKAYCSLEKIAQNYQMNIVSTWVNL